MGFKTRRTFPIILSDFLVWHNKSQRVELLSGAEYLRGLERACLLENTLSSLEASTSIDKSISENFVWLFLLKLLGLNSESQCKGLVRQTKNYFPVTSPFVHFCDQIAL